MNNRNELEPREGESGTDFWKRMKAEAKKRKQAKAEQMDLEAHAQMKRQRAAERRAFRKANKDQPRTVGPKWMQ